MTVRWTVSGLGDLESLHAFIEADNRDAAADTVDRIVELIDRLPRHPELGRKGRVAGTREVILPPFVTAYRQTRAAIEILGIIHSARRWPDSF
ncbi:MAG TPA: type II toxin-antitoxin system RelE/ParE family toxin [Bryobacteraceae bacterium]|jgi:plasmid stabilization system protein ParE|nr:type II toxin-antitoxin system RelE/ParE family toxin [Bryobacteraceae bacterium]